MSDQHKPSDVEMQPSDEWARKASAPDPKSAIEQVAPRKYGTMLPRKKKKGHVVYEVEIYKAFGGGEFENDSGDEAEKPGPGGDEANQITQAFNPINDFTKPKTEMARATIAGVNSWWKTYFFLLKGFLGSGMLTLPMGFCNGGAMFSVLCMAAVCMFSILGMTKLLEVRIAKGGSYSDMAHQALGSGGKFAIDISLACCQVLCGCIKA